MHSQAQIAASEHTISDLTTQMADLTAAHTQQNTTLQATVADKFAQIEALTTQLSASNASCSELSSRLHSITLDRNHLSDESAAMSEKLEGLEGALEGEREVVDLKGP